MRDLSAGIERQKSQQLYRQRHIVGSPQGSEIRLNNRACLSFCSNDYLGLANHPLMIKALQHGAEKYGVGSGASHLVNGHSAAHHALEEALAEFTGRPRALLFSTGYMANLGILNALVKRGDVVYEDRLNHASLIDAGLLSGAKLVRYKHNDSDALQQRLNEHDAGQAFILSDAVFSMDGDLAPLPQLSSMAKKHDAWLMIDDAHGIGVLGKQGKGSIEHYGLQPDSVPILMGTLGKAFGTFGAFVAGSEELIETLIQHARTYIYTTALPPAIAYATLTSLKIIQQENWRREKLQTLITRFRAGAETMGLKLPESVTPIQPLIIGESGQALNLSQQLLEQGILITAIRPPTVPKGSARLRITFSATHTEAQVDRLLDTLSALI